MAWTRIGKGVLAAGVGVILGGVSGAVMGPFMVGQGVGAYRSWRAEVAFSREKEQTRLRDETIMEAREDMRQRDKMIEDALAEKRECKASAARDRSALAARE